MNIVYFCPQVHYEELNVTFLPDITDSISAYEQRGQANSPSGRSTCSLEEQGLHALSGLPVEQQVEMNTGECWLYCCGQ